MVVPTGTNDIIYTLGEVGVDYRSFAESHTWLQQCRVHTKRPLISLTNRIVWINVTSHDPDVFILPNGTHSFATALRLRSPSSSLLYGGGAIPCTIPCTIPAISAIGNWVLAKVPVLCAKPTNKMMK